jgi:hypothetical protein
MAERIWWRNTLMTVISAQEGFVEGHDFSRAARKPDKHGASGPGKNHSSFSSSHNQSEDCEISDIKYISLRAQPNLSLAHGPATAPSA